MSAHPQLIQLVPYLHTPHVVCSLKQNYGLQINSAETQTSNENVHRKVRDREVLRRQDCILNATKYFPRAISEGPAHQYQQPL